jgi:hypothetical protein
MPAVEMVDASCLYSRDRAKGRLILLGLWGLGVLAWVCLPELCRNDDSWFYPVVARNIVLAGKQSFSGVFPTNGVHPLWLYLLTGYSYLVSLANPAWLHTAAYAIPLSASLVLAGAWCFSRASEELGLSRLLAVYVPLLFALLIGNLYSEAQAHYAALGLLLLVCTRPELSRRRAGFGLGLTLGLVFLARLDSVFLVGAVAVWFARRSRRPGPILACAAGFLVLALPYLISNLVFFGGATPVSGWMKTSFPRPVLKGFFEAGTSLDFAGYKVIYGWLPVVLSPLLLLWVRKRLAGRAGVAWAFCAGSALHCLYTVLFTREATFWPWYYVLPVVTGGVCAALALRALPSQTSAAARQPWRRWLGRTATALLILGFVGMTARRWIHWEHSAVQVQATYEFVRSHGAEDQTILVADCPGYVAFKTRAHIVAVDMLTANRPLFERMRQAPNALEWLLHHCAQQGYVVTYLLHNSTHWLGLNPDLHAVTYYDPRALPRREAIGHLDLPEPPVERRQLSNGAYFTAWRLGAPAP